MKVEIINPETVKRIYKNHGEFACVCYDTPTELAEKVGKGCAKSGHFSGSRCEYIKFHIEGLDRGTAEQALRHEIGTYIPFDEQDNYRFSDYSELVIDENPTHIVKNMASFRYIDKDGFQYATPPMIAADAEAKRQYDELMKNINETRKQIAELLVSKGCDKKKVNEDVNFVLPRATTTSFTIGFTPEALIHFCHKRLCTRAQYFIKQLATAMKAEVEKFNPTFSAELVPQCEHLLWCPEGRQCCGKKPTKEKLKTILEENN